MPELNDLAPDFEAQDDQGQTVRLSDFQGQWVVLYFYPKAMTKGCTIQAQALRDDYAKFTGQHTAVLGVSPDTVADQAKFKAKEALPFTLIADADHQIAEQYGVWKLKNLFGRKFWGVERTTFLIDPAGKIAQIFPKVRPAEHSRQVLDVLASLQD